MIVEGQDLEVPDPPSDEEVPIFKKEDKQEPSQEHASPNLQESKQVEESR